MKSPNDCTIAEGMGLGNPFLLDRTVYRVNKYGTPCLEEASANYWAYRGKSQLFKRFLNEIPAAIQFQNNSLFGIEVETENVHAKRRDDDCPPGWSKKNDGSLRNGVEYVSYPANSAETRALIASLYLFFVEQLKKKPDFSWRTSIHGHLNVRPLTTEQLGNLLLLYCPFEFSLFQFAAPERVDNIFCVPVTESNLRFRLRDFFLTKKRGGSPVDALFNLFDGWDKYSALNLSRLRDLGTVEFRHMGGTWDTEKIENWIGLIGALYDASIRLSRDWIMSQLVNLNSLSNYSEFKNKVFGEFVGNILGEPDNFAQVLSHGVSFAKQCLIQTPDINKQIEKKSPADLWANKLFEQFKRLPQDKEKPAPKKKTITTGIHNPIFTFQSTAALMGQFAAAQQQQMGLATGIQQVPPPPSPPLQPLNEMHWEVTPNFVVDDFLPDQEEQ